MAHAEICLKAKTQKLTGLVREAIRTPVAPLKELQAFVTLDVRVLHQS